MYQDELYREAKLFVQGWQYILEDAGKLLDRVAAWLRINH